MHCVCVCCLNLLQPFYTHCLNKIDLWVIKFNLLVVDPSRTSSKIASWAYYLFIKIILILLQSGLTRHICDIAMSSHIAATAITIATKRLLSLLVGWNQSNSTQNGTYMGLLLLLLLLAKLTYNDHKSLIKGFVCSRACFYFVLFFLSRGCQRRGEKSNFILVLVAVHFSSTTL
mgnify:CR=1 FL=1